MSFLLCKWPAFMSKPKLELLNNLDLFLFILVITYKILDLQYPIRNDTVSHLTKCLKKHQHDITVITYRLIFVATSLSMTLVVIIGIIMMFYKRKWWLGTKTYRRHHPRDTGRFESTVPLRRKSRYWKRYLQIKQYSRFVRNFILREE